MRYGPARQGLARFARRIAYEVHRPRSYWAPRDVYQAIAVLRDRRGRPDSPLGLSEMRVFSQNGEDGVLAEIFARIGAEREFFVEFGVGDGTECNTRFLADVLGWAGVYFERDAIRRQRLAERLCNRTDVRIVDVTITPANADEVFAAASVPHEFDLLSIDIDGQDFWVWQAITHVRPRVVVIEYNSALAMGESLVEPAESGPWDGTSFIGASLSALEALGAAKGYSLVHTDLTGVNAFFVRTDLAAPFGPMVRHGGDLFLRGYRHPEDPLGREYHRLSDGSVPRQHVDDPGELG